MSARKSLTERELFEAVYESGVAVNAKEQPFVKRSMADECRMAENLVLKTIKHIYGIQNPAGYFKVGIAVNPVSRFNEIQVGSPFELTLAWTRKALFAQRVERVMHRRLADWHERGEWFRGGEAEVEEAETILDGIRDRMKGVLDDFPQHFAKAYVPQAEQGFGVALCYRALEEHLWNLCV